MSSKLFERMPQDVKRLHKIARRERRQQLRQEFWQSRQRGQSGTPAKPGANGDY